MIAARDMTDEHQPDAVIDYLATICSKVRDAGAGLQWWWLGEAHVRLSAQTPGRPIITLELREITVSHARTVGYRIGSPITPHDVVAMLLGYKSVPRPKR